MSRRAAIIFKANIRSESRSKGVPGRFLRILHENLLETVRKLASVEVVLAQSDRGELTLIAPDRKVRFQTLTLADQLTAATEWAFSSGYTQVLLLAADVAEVSPQMIASAFSTLDSDDARSVIGPSGDGGFWLAGFNRWPDVDWSKTGLRTDLAASLLVEQLRSSGIPVSYQDRVDDIDGRSDALLAVDRLLRKHCFAFQNRLASALSPPKEPGIPAALHPRLVLAAAVSGRAPPGP